MTREEISIRLKGITDKKELDKEIKKILKEQDKEQLDQLPKWAFWQRMDIAHPIISTVLFLLPFVGLFVMTVIDMVKTLGG